MKSMVEQLSVMGEYDSLKERTGWDDAIINNKSAYEIVKELCAWHLGDLGDWWETFYCWFNELKGAEKSEQKDNQEG